MPVPHLNIRIVQRSKGNSAVAGAAYQAGEKLFSEYDQKHKDYRRKQHEVVYTEIMLPTNAPPEYADRATLCALPGFVDSKNEEKTERNAGYLVVSHSGGGMLRQGTRKGIRRTPANRGMRAHRIVKSLDISEDVCHGLCP